MSGSVGVCWRCQRNTWSGQPCVHCGAPEEPECPECGGPADERVLAGMKCGRCAYGVME
jgi:predicted amidophosphoribosyltransferase